MFVVSGCPRSGTSLMMSIMREVFGEDRILGKKFPQERSNKEQGPEEPDHIFALRQYALSKVDEEEIEKEITDTKDLNPNGFWEMMYTVAGCHYRFGDRERLKSLLEEEDKSICKIVSQGLLASDPQYIDKVIYMLRHPRAVAKSQERLKHSFPVAEMNKMVIHTPKMFNQVTLMAAQWFNAYTHIDPHIVLFDDLVENPAKVLAGIQEFLGEGDFTKANNIIEPRLRRSHPEEVDSPMWEDSEMLYTMMRYKNYRGIIDYMKNPRRETNKDIAKWFCHRLGRHVVRNECLTCQSNVDFVTNQIVNAASKDIDWRNEPCVFECGFDVDKEADQYLTVADSIAKNHWRRLTNR